MKLSTAIVLLGVLCGMLLTAVGLIAFASSTVSGIMFGGIMMLAGAFILADSMSRI